MTQTPNAKAKQAAITAMENCPVTPTGLVEYHSHGRVLIIGENDAASFALSCLGEGLNGQILQTDTAEDADNVTIPLAGRKLEISGHLGGFTARIGEPDTPVFQTLSADVILDLQGTPTLAMAVPPPGYRVCSTDFPSVEIACAELSELTGTFEKPRFFDYDPGICAHSRSGQAGCRNCIDACPTEAIVSLGELVEVNPYLCQGGGICATACPSGAIRYVYPPLKDQIDRLRHLLRAYLEVGGEHPVLVLCAEAGGLDAADLADNQLLFALEELASQGIEFWLTALAFGAEQVVLVDAGVPDSVRPWLGQQIDIAGAILKSLGYPDAALLSCSNLAELPALSGSGPQRERATYAGNNDKRNILFSAIDALAGGFSDAVFGLPQGAPLGRINVDGDLCTLCMACTSVCPANAVTAAGDRPALQFREANCVQCGICESACPESAISLEPRLNLDRDGRLRARVIHEQQPFHCISCGKPFATQNVINAMLGKLQAHPMFQTERALSRLKMCDDCRVVDVVQDDDMMNLNS